MITGQEIGIGMLVMLGVIAIWYVLYNAWRLGVRILQALEKINNSLFFISEGISHIDRR